MCQGMRSLVSTFHASEQSRGRVCAARRISAGHSAQSVPCQEVQIRFRMTGEGGDVGEGQASGVWL